MTIAPDGWDNYIGGRILHEFSISPAEFSRTVNRNRYNIQIDITRRIKDTVISISPLNNYGVIQANDYPIRNELANDDSDNLDEDLKPDNPSTLVFSFDAPGIPRKSGQDIVHIRHLHFEEFVRISFQNIVPPNSETGSRSSPKRKWSMSNTLLRDRSSSTTDPHYQRNTFFSALQNGVYASMPLRLTNTAFGTGRIYVTPHHTISNLFDGYQIRCRTTAETANLEWELVIKDQATVNSYSPVALSNSSPSGPWTINTPAVDIIINNSTSKPYLDGAVLQFLVIELNNTRNYITTE